MTAAKIEFAREWYAKGVCPGCGAPLEKVAGQGVGHWLPGQMVRTRTGPRTSVLGDSQDGFGKALPGDPRRCPWSADDLTSLVLIGSGVVGANA